MASSNVTPNLDLPMFSGSDKPAWLTDWNDTVTKVDAGYNQIQQNVNETANQAGKTQEVLEETNQTVNSLSTRMTSAESDILTNTQNITETAQSVIGLGNNVSSLQNDLNSFSQDTAYRISSLEKFSNCEHNFLYIMRPPTHNNVVSPEIKHFSALGNVFISKDSVCASINGFFDVQDTAPQIEQHLFIEIPLEYIKHNYTINENIIGLIGIGDSRGTSAPEGAQQDTGGKLCNVSVTEKNNQLIIDLKITHIWKNWQSYIVSINSKILEFTD